MFTGVQFSRWGSSTYYMEPAWRVYVDGEYVGFAPTRKAGRRILWAEIQRREGQKGA